MSNPLVLYLIGAAILSIGLLILLMAQEITRGIGRLWKKSLLGEDRNVVNIDSRNSDTEEQTGKARLVFWRIIGALITFDGLVWLVRATEAAFRSMPHAPH